MRAKDRKNAGSGGGGIRGVSGMFVGIGTAEGPQRRAERVADGPHRCRPMSGILRVRVRPELWPTAIQGDRTL